MSIARPNFNRVRLTLFFPVQVVERVDHSVDGMDASVNQEYYRHERNRDWSSAKETREELRESVEKERSEDLHVVQMIGKQRPDQEQTGAL